MVCVDANKDALLFIKGDGGNRFLVVFLESAGKRVGFVFFAGEECFSAHAVVRSWCRVCRSVAFSANAYLARAEAFDDVFFLDVKEKNTVDKNEFVKCCSLAHGTWISIKDIVFFERSEHERVHVVVGEEFSASDAFFPSKGLRIVLGNA